MTRNILLHPLLDRSRIETAELTSSKHPRSAAEVSNCTDEPVQVKIFEPGHSNAAVAASDSLVFFGREHW